MVLLDPVNVDDPLFPFRCRNRRFSGPSFRRESIFEHMAPVRIRTIKFPDDYFDDRSIRKDLPVPVKKMRFIHVGYCTNNLGKRNPFVNDRLIFSPGFRGSLIFKIQVRSLPFANRESQTIRGDKRLEDRKRVV